MAAIVGTNVTFTEIPAASVNPYNTANAFIVGAGDWGSNTQPLLVHSIQDVQNAVGPRSATNSTLYDACDAAFHEGVSTAYIGRVTGPAPTSASLQIEDNTAAVVATVTALYPGTYGNQILVAVNNASSYATVTLSDTFGNTLTTSPNLTTASAIVNWLNTNGYTTAVAGASTSLPATLTPTQMAGGSNDTPSLTQWQNALNSFGASLGPGQVFAPGQTNSSLNGIWQILGQHGLNNNRVAIADMDDNTAATALISDIGTDYNNLGVGPIGFWAGNQLIPGLVPLTTRSVAPSPIIAGLIARSDATGNPNLMPAGPNGRPQYVTGPATLVTGTLSTYSFNDLQALYGAGINTFANRWGVYENYGFRSSILPTTDAVYYQFNHQRLKMALTADAQVLSEQFVFDQLDQQQSSVVGFNTALTARLKSYQQLGAIWNFSVNTGAGINTPVTLQAGQLNVAVNLQFSPGAEVVSIVLNVLPLTQNVPVVTS